MRYQWRKTGSQMILYEVDDTNRGAIAAVIEMADPGLEGADFNYVASGPMIGATHGYRRYREAMEAVEELVRRTGGTMTTSHRDFRYRPL